MITGKDARRRSLAAVAIRCFLEQTHVDKELLIINDSGVPLSTGFPNVREILLAARRDRTLGDLRNEGIRQSTGDLIVQWDDDDWHHPARIATQALSWERGAAVLLRQQIRYSFVSQSAFLFYWPTGIDGTILHERNASPSYPSISRGEDTEFLRHFSKRQLLDCSPPLYIRFYHGTNTWEASHIMGEFASAVNRVSLLPVDASLLRFVLKEYYNPPIPCAPDQNG